MKFGITATLLIKMVLANQVHADELPFKSDPQAVAAQVKAYVDQVHKDQGIFATVVVADNAKVIHAQSLGYRDVEHKRRNTVDTPSKLASITKQFTAVGLLVLQQEGRLSVHDTLEQHVPGFPYAKQIRLHHLLQHTSGLPNYVEMREFDELMGASRDVSSDELIGKMYEVFTDRPLEFEPGQGWRYSDTGFTILAFVIERVANMPYADFMKTRVFGPMDMRSSFIDRFAVHRDYAKGYIQKGSDYEEAPFINMNCASGSGSMVSTGFDMVKYHTALQTNKLLSKESLMLMENEDVPIPNDSFHYGYGVAIGRVYSGAYRVVNHMGGINGYSSMFQRFPELGLVVVVLMNVKSSSIGAMVDKISRIALGEEE